MNFYNIYDTDRYAVRTSIGNEVRRSVWSAVTFTAKNDPVGGSAWDFVYDTIDISVHNPIGEKLKEYEF